MLFSKLSQFFENDRKSEQFYDGIAKIIKSSFVRNGKPVYLTMFFERVFVNVFHHVLDHVLLLSARNVH